MKSFYGLCTIITVINMLKDMSFIIKLTIKGKIFFPWVAHSKTSPSQHLHIFSMVLTLVQIHDSHNNDDNIINTNLSNGFSYSFELNNQPVGRFMHGVETLSSDTLRLLTLSLSLTVYAVTPPRLFQHSITVLCLLSTLKLLAIELR